MTINQFLNVMCYRFPQRPYYISKGRWQGMIKWYFIRSVEMNYMKVGEEI